MGAPNVREVKVQLDRERTLRFDFNAFVALEEASGVSFLGGFDTSLLSSAKGTRDFLWAGLLHEDPGLTREQVGAMLDMGKVVELAQAVGQALNSSLPKRKAGKGARPRKAGR